MQPMLANYTAGITELKKSPTQLLENAQNQASAILNHNVASAYLVPTQLYEKMIKELDDYYLLLEVKKRFDYNENDLLSVSLDDL